VNSEDGRERTHGAPIANGCGLSEVDPLRSPAKNLADRATEHPSVSALSGSEVHLHGDGAHDPAARTSDPHAFIASLYL
jgi:hypothetical protein